MSSEDAEKLDSGVSSERAGKPGAGLSSEGVGRSGAGASAEFSGALEPAGVSRRADPSECGEVPGSRGVRFAVPALAGGLGAVALPGRLMSCSETAGSSAGWVRPAWSGAAGFRGMSGLATRSVPRGPPMLPAPSGVSETASGAAEVSRASGVSAVGEALTLTSLMPPLAIYIHRGGSLRRRRFHPPSATPAPLLGATLLCQPVPLPDDTAVPAWRSLAALSVPAQRSLAALSVPAWRSLAIPSVSAWRSLAALSVLAWRSLAIPSVPAHAVARCTVHSRRAVQGVRVGRRVSRTGRESHSAGLTHVGDSMAASGSARSSPPVTVTRYTMKMV